MEGRNSPEEAVKMLKSRLPGEEVEVFTSITPVQAAQKIAFFLSQKEARDKQPDYLENLKP